MKAAGKLCELCDEQAFVYCSADSAFLCWNCDFKVHRANFLVARHLRQLLCANCKSVCQYSNHLCEACSCDETSSHVMACSNLSFSSSSPSSSSDCLSTSESSSNDFKLVKSRSQSRPTASLSEVSDTNNDLESVLETWCKKLGLKRHAVVPTAVTALRFCLRRLTGVPFRLSLAAAFWFGLRTSGDRSVASWRNLRKVEELSGVPAKLIVAMGSRLARVMRLRRRIRPDLEEGWAECNV